jgi:hypothetical protein
MQRVRTEENPDVIAQAIREEVRRVNPRLLVGISTMRPDAVSLEAELPMEGDETHH